MDQATLLDQVLEKLDLPSDYALAKEWGLTTAGMSQYRTGKSRFDAYMLHRVAETLDKDPRELTAQRELSKEPTGERREYWETLLKKRSGALSGGAFIALCIATCASLGSGQRPQRRRRSPLRLTFVPIIRRGPNDVGRRPWGPPGRFFAV